MKTLSSQKLRLALVVLLLVVFALNITQEAGAQTGPATAGAADLPPASPLGGSPVPGGPGYVAISALDFKPLNSSSMCSYEDMVITNTGATGGTYFATFQIPNGVTIKKMVVYYKDENAAPFQELGVYLTYLILGHGWDYAASFSSHLSLTGWVYGQTTSILYPVVDLSVSTYGIRLELPASASVALSGVRIDYGYQTNLPTILHP
jgi:hypothetical protein